MADGPTHQSEGPRGLLNRAVVGRLFAEFVVIVVGVLVALAVDAWYSGIQDERLAEAYEQRLAQELQGAREFLEAQLRQLTNVRAASERLVGAFEHDRDVDPSEFLVDLNNSSRRRSGSTPTTTYDDLVTTGNLSLIADPEVRATLEQGYRDFRRIDATRQYGVEYRRVVRSALPIPVQLAVQQSCRNMSGVDFHCATELTAVELLSADNPTIVDELLARTELREAFRVHYREMVTFEQDLNRAFNRLEQAEAALNR